MSLSIKNPEAHRLAQEIAAKTDDSLTKVVIDSLRERNERLATKPKKATAAELMAIAKRVSAGVKRPYLDHGDLLYDEYGLPK